MTNNIWNPFLETLPLKQMRELQFKRFKTIFKYAYDNSPFYRKKYQEAGINIDSIKTPVDVRLIPFTAKEEFRDAQEGKEPFPYGEVLAVPIEEVTNYHQTTGTTGKPVRFADAWSDWEFYAENWAMMMYSRGLRKSDRVYVPFPYHLFIAFWGGHYGAEKLGAEVVPGGQTSTEQRVREMKELQCTAIMCTPTYALRLAEIAEKTGINPRTDIPVRMIFCAGEPGASIPATKRRIEEVWNAKVYDHCGATEAPLWAFECEAQQGLQLNEPNYLVEILNPSTFQPAAPGEIGTAVVTNLNRLAMPSIRFDLKDLTRLSASGEPCPCGRTWRKIEGGIIGRRDDVTKVRGVLFSPTSVEQVVRDMPELSDEFEVVVTREDDYDRILVMVEVVNEHAARREEIAQKLIRELRNGTQLRCEVEIRDFGTLPRYEMKSKRFKDLRATH
jgi:phenylacetate-CoA ligase